MRLRSYGEAGRYDASDVSEPIDTVRTDVQRDKRSAMVLVCLIRRGVLLVCHKLSNKMLEKHNEVVFL